MIKVFGTLELIAIFLAVIEIEQYEVEDDEESIVELIKELKRRGVYFRARKEATEDGGFLGNYELYFDKTKQEFYYNNLNLIRELKKHDKN